MDPHPDSNSQEPGPKWDVRPGRLLHPSDPRRTVSTQMQVRVEVRSSPGPGTTAHIHIHVLFPCASRSCWVLSYSAPILASMFFFASLCLALPRLRDFRQDRLDSVRLGSWAILLAVPCPVACIKLGWYVQAGE
ncbi:hypothetical protein BDW71DRAFT_15776 [Aspergillus fruticulosus]